MKEELIARKVSIKPENLIETQFKSVLNQSAVKDALFLDSQFKFAIGIGNIQFRVPVIQELFKNSEIARYISSLTGNTKSVLILNKDNAQDIQLFLYAGSVTEVKDIPPSVRDKINSIIQNSSEWAGTLNEKGEHIINVKTPSPGPHFFVNLLLGNRIGFANALQTTPKSVIDRLGRGSFRAHAGVHVLAVRWDLRQEENGFPANRQFYLVEDCKKIFYSADPNDQNIETAICVHTQNQTRITYKTKCGLEVVRTIFLLPQYEGLPLATEVQRIEIKNLTSQPRNLKLITIGMFGTNATHAMMEDVLYTNIIMESKIIRNDDGRILAIAPEYFPEYCREDNRFNTLLVRNGKDNQLATEFCSNYNEFVGNGTLENPESVALLSNKFYRKGPGFFALAASFTVNAGEVKVADSFTGLSSKKINPKYNENTFKAEITALIEKFGRKEAVNQAFEDHIKFYNRYSSFLQVKSDNQIFNAYVNKNLPFQVLYQTFVSRSFCQTQKGYREIGFREIQDIYASMYYFVSMGSNEFVKELLKEWASKIFEFGYAYHNFFWTGKEPGKWSDDALWFIQAVYRYINLTGDIKFLHEECQIAGKEPLTTRSIYKTIQAVIHYSGVVSVGKHGLPLLDNADWNDCLKIDNNFIDGITKEKLYKQQIEKSGKTNTAFESDYSESVMNAFLLKIAIDEMIVLADEINDKTYESYLKDLSQNLLANLQKHAWKGDFFARVLLNRYKNGEYEYIGAQNDGLSLDPNLNGTYFLNSFSWAILSDSASEEEITIMLNTLEKTLKTPFGIKLMTLTDLGKVANDTATGHYYPGDRENGGVFKHASMMATAALFKAAKEVNDKKLASRLSELGFWMIDLVIPYTTMNEPYLLCGNPRICTQYINSETGENIGPLLSGTSTWLNLTLLSALGVEYTKEGISLDPILRASEEKVYYTLNPGKANYHITIKKPAGFSRTKDHHYSLTLDGKKLETAILPLLSDGKDHDVELTFQ